MQPKKFQSEEYINPDKFNGKEFKAYRGWIVEVLSHLNYIYYRYCTDYIITGNSEMTVEFVILTDLFEIDR